MYNNNVYAIVNDVFKQSTGLENISVVDGASFVDAGSDVFSSTNNTNHFITTLMEAITRVIFAIRPYNGMFKQNIRESSYGAIQKISFGNLDAEKDESYGLVDGQSVDMYKVNKPKATEKFYSAEAPYQYHISLNYRQMKQSFQGERGVASFVSGIFTNVFNQRTIKAEGLMRATIAAAIAANQAREINVFELYNKTHPNAQLSSVDEAWYSPDFLRYLVMTINLTTDKFRNPLQGVYNDGTILRHTPYDRQTLYVATDIEYLLETVSSYAAYHDRYVSLRGYDTAAYWQTFNDPYHIITTAPDGSTVDIDGVVAVLGDIDAYGIFPVDNWTSTTPFNSAGGYANTYWHENNRYFYDTSENFVFFTVRDTSEPSDPEETAKAKATSK